ncbi:MULTISPECIES: DUF4231 domain-containing protein [Niastella]|uniref:DUF4231 domain-containing protein n=1 Tax=Niastella soli TaxID=2821487 RepID=A0ABS3Z5L8_9BACT|nr:DUF4231 domain-containing protein [Niastella soli]MBO9205449.1 DUF4231 domain-containing protein [Niastella soli]
MTATPTNTFDVSFPNKNTARVVIPSDTESIETIHQALAIPNYKSVILVLGGAESIAAEIKPNLSQLFDRGIAKAVIQAEALVIDGGTLSGVMQLMGEGLAGRDARIKLVGIAPESLVTYPTKNTNGSPALVELEPNHSHFVLTPGKQWDDATATFYQLVRYWIHSTNKTSSNTEDKTPCLALLAGGGAISKNEVLYAVRKNIPVIVIAGSGGLADEIAKAITDKATNSPDRQIAEIVADGDIQVFTLGHPVKGLERLIIRKLGIDKLLKQAWESFANYDHNAKRQQKKFNRLQKWIIWTGLIGTALVIINQLPKSDGTFDWIKKFVRFAETPIHLILLIIPITLTILLTIYNKFKPGNKWLLLRSGAEAIKREIYKYRVRGGVYANNSENQLSQAIETVTRRIMRTEVNASAIIPYTGPFPPDMDAANKCDDGFCELTPDQYVELRLGDQINYFTDKSLKLEKKLKIYSYAAYITGGVGTFLVALNQDLWLPLTTAIVTAIGTYFSYRQTESTLVKYNQAIEDLKNIRKWWYALNAEEQADPVNINSLVEHTEQVLQSETDGWVQQIQNALDNLRKTPDKADGDGK